MNESNIITLPLDRKILNEQLPSTNGIYMFTVKGKFMYIGKSVNIKARVIPHIESAKLDKKEAAICNSSDSISYYVTDSEFNALLLESRLIQTHKPRYNVRWMDDKSYLYIKITMSDIYPRVVNARKEPKQNRKDKYFGPFPSTRAAIELIRAIRRVIPFDTQNTVGKRACFYSKIGQCNPCPGNIEKETDPSLRKALQKQYRNNLRQVCRILEGQYTLLLKDMYVQIKVLSEAQQYEEAMEVRNRVLRLEHLVKGRILDRNRDNGTQYNRSSEGLEKLQSMLVRYFPDLPPPNRIECYDISNTTQQEITASMVVMTEGVVDKSQYRKFRIKDVTVQSDFEAMNEVLTRRTRREGWPKPDLLVVDGGKPQVRTALEALGRAGYDVPVIGIAKHPDRLVIGTHDMTTIRPPVNHPGFILIQALRDESHRFAKKYHVLLRTKKMYDNGLPRSKNHAHRRTRTA